MSLLRFDMDEDVLKLLASFSQENHIAAGSFSALGAAREVTIAYYNLETKQYEDHTFAEDLEILNSTGNIGVLDGKPAIHCHGIFGRKDCSTIGGHIKKLIVSATCELTLTILDGTLKRSFDEKTGLNLLI